jgi:hypothetical protein
MYIIVISVLTIILSIIDKKISDDERFHKFVLRKNKIIASVALILPILLYFLIITFPSLFEFEFFFILINVALPVVINVRPIFIEVFFLFFLITGVIYMLYSLNKRFNGLTLIHYELVFILLFSILSVPILYTYPWLFLSYFVFFIKFPELINRREFVFKEIVTINFIFISLLIARSLQFITIESVPPEIVRAGPIEQQIHFFLLFFYLIFPINTRNINYIVALLKKTRFIPHFFRKRGNLLIHMFFIFSLLISFSYGFIGFCFGSRDVILVYDEYDKALDNLSLDVADSIKESDFDLNSYSANFNNDMFRRNIMILLPSIRISETIVTPDNIDYYYSSILNGTYKQLLFLFWKNSDTRKYWRTKIENSTLFLFKEFSYGAIYYRD